MTQGEFQEIIKIHIVGRVYIKDIAKAYRISKKALQARFQRAGIKANSRCMVPGFGFKKCSDCKVILRRNEFYEKQTRCKACSMLRSRDFRKTNPGYDKRQRDPLAQLRYDLKRSYGITPEDRADLMDSQRGCCAICGESLRMDKTGCHVDHDHDSGAIRGLLCSWCNSLLGQAKDSPEILTKAITYLTKGQTL